MKNITTLNKLVLFFDNLPPKKIFTAQEITDKLVDYLDNEKEQIEEAFKAGYNNGNIDTCVTNNEYFFNNFKR